MNGEFAIPPFFDHFATFAWAFSGAAVGVRRGYDVVGVLVIALVSSTGGGLIRDGLLLHRTPTLLTDGAYLALIVLATVLVCLAAKGLVTGLTEAWTDKLIELIDAVGIPAFAIVGMQMALAQDVSMSGVVLIGVINGVGGGLLRDVIVRETPRLLLPGQYSALVVLIACVVFVGLSRGIVMDATKAALITIAAYLFVRSLTIAFNWRSSALVRAESTR
jgi:uncharacterized membrane protein YeiH